VRDAKRVETFSIRAFRPPGDAAALRREVRAFLAEHQPCTDAAKRANSWAVGDTEFSRALGAAGFIGMIWPKAYGGHARHPLERYVVLEELLAAGAPVGMHWIADRQSGPLLLRYGSEAQRQRFLPGMARGEIYACIGMSEPGAGSDLASVRTRGVKEGDTWRINGQKVWTTNAQNSHVMIALVRTSEGEKRQDGLTQFLIELDRPGVTVRPIIDLAGGHDFNEVFLEDVILPEENRLGPEGAGWKQVTAELSLERSGPERYLSSYALLTELIRLAAAKPDPVLTNLIGRFTAELWCLRQMSLSTAAKLAAGEDPALEAAMVKDLGNSFEQELPRAAQSAFEALDLSAPDDLARVLSVLLLVSPSFSLRGGTREILRGIVARGLGLR
jgi:alkylation response protein AidB-like acyl-CoA dehydrogenase